jgi:hypothetical protein
MSNGSFYSRLRLTLLKWMEYIGTSASNMASNAKLKANEINLENRRREILTNFSLRAFELWQKGEKLPEQLSEMLVELSDTEERLSVLRAQKYAKVSGEPAPSQVEPAEQSADGTPEAGEEGSVACAVEDEPVACGLVEPYTGPEGEAAEEPEGETAAQEPAEASPCDGPEATAADVAPEPETEPESAARQSAARKSAQKADKPDAEA